MFRRYRCACKERPGLIKVTRVRTMSNTWDVNHFERMQNGKLVYSSTSDGWYDKNNGEWPISPLCRKRWWPVLKDAFRRLKRVS